MSVLLSCGRLTGYCMEMQLDLLSFVPILSAAGPAVRQVLVFGGAFLLLAFPVIVLRVWPFAIAVAKDWKDPFVGLCVLVVFGGLSGALISYELVRSYAFSPLWYYALPAVSAVSVYSQYVSGKCPGMIRALSHDSCLVREAAADALGQVGDRRAVDPLIKALSDDKYGITRVREAAAKALVQLGDVAVDPLVKTLTDPKGSVRLAAAKALQQLGQPEWVRCIRGDNDDFARLASSGEPGGSALLIAALSDGDRDVRRRVPLALVRLGATALDPLVNALSDDSSDIRDQAARALGQLGDRRAVDPLLKALSGDDSRVRNRAAEALGYLGDKRAVDPLIKILSDDELCVDPSAVEALGRLGDKRAVDPLMALRFRAGNSSVQRALAEALGQLGDKRAVDKLIRWAFDDSPSVREAAANALRQLGDKQAVNAFIKALGHNRSSVRRPAAEALGRLGDKKAVVPLIKALPARSDVRESIVVALGRLGDKRAVDPLIEELAKDYYDSWLLRSRVAEALGRLGDERAVDPLIEASSNGFVAPAAKKALKKLGYKK